MRRGGQETAPFRVCHLLHCQEEEPARQGGANHIFISRPIEAGRNFHSVRFFCAIFPARWGRNAFHAPPFSPKWGRIEDEKNGNTKKEEYLYAQNDYYSRKSGLLYGLIHFFFGKIGFQTGYRAVTFGWMHKIPEKKFKRILNSHIWK